MVSAFVVRTTALLLLVAWGNCQEPSCHPISPCKCRFPAGDGFDLSNSDADVSIPGTANLEYYFNPCPLQPGITNHCGPNNVALCSVQIAPPHNTTVLGLQTNVTFGQTTLPVDPTVLHTIQYLYLDSKNATQSTTVILQCNTSDTRGSITLDPNQPGRLILNSKRACVMQVDLPVVDDGLSSGASFLIIFFTLFAMYFFGGMAILKFIKGAQGVEMIPNYEFWTGLPSLVRDGFMFAITGCRGADSYDRI